MTESLLIQMKLLKLLSQKYKLAIATSRPRFEALFAAKLQKISRLISDKCIVAKEDVVREKPYPDPLLKAEKLLNAKSPVYIGDTVNDLVAARKAGMHSIFIGKEKLGDYQLENVNDLERILL
jgi:HAD superfamily hydrolase (TIGR01549 family)